MATKKADVTEYPAAFNHVGLLVNEPPAQRDILSFITSAMGRTGSYSPIDRRTRPSNLALCNSAVSKSWLSFVQGRLDESRHHGFYHTDAPGLKWFTKKSSREARYIEDAGSPEIIPSPFRRRYGRGESRRLGQRWANKDSGKRCLGGIPPRRTIQGDHRSAHQAVAELRQRLQSPAKREALRKLSVYLKNNAARIDYPRYRAAGLPMAAELWKRPARRWWADAANRRACPTGRCEYAEAVLRLRTAPYDGEFGPLWDARLRRAA